MHRQKHTLHHQHGENLISIDAYAYGSRLNAINSGLKTVTALYFLVFGLASGSITVSALLMVVMMAVTVLAGGLAFRDYLSLLMLPLVFISLSSLAILFDFSARPLGEYNIFCGFFYLCTSRTYILQTVGLVFRAMGAISCLYLLILSTPTSEIIRILRCCRVPLIICELMNMVYRFIFILLDVQYRMTISARSRLGFSGLKTAFYSFGNIAANLLILSLRRSNAYYDALESRCYDGELRFLTKERPIRARHVTYPCLLAVFLIIVLIIVKLTGFY